MPHAADHAGVFHVFEQARGALVADAQVALYQRDAGLAVLEHDFHCLVVHGVLFSPAKAAERIICNISLAIDRAAFEHAFDVVGFAVFFEERDDAVHFVIAHKSAMYPCGQAVACGQIQHVTQPQQVFGAHLVEDGAAIDLARYLKRNARGDIGLDEAGNYIHTGALGGQNQVDAGRTRFLRQAGDQLFDFFAHHHHQVGQLVDHDHDMRQAFQRLGRFGREAEGVGDQLFARARFFDAGVVARQVAHAQFAHQAIAALHFAHAPVQAVRGLLHVGHNGRQQVRNAFVHAHFQHLGVDHEQAHFVSGGFVQQAQNHGVDAHRFARARGAGHQHVRHARQIHHNGRADDVFAQPHGQ